MHKLFFIFLFTINIGFIKAMNVFNQESQIKFLGIVTCEINQGALPAGVWIPKYNLEESYWVNNEGKKVAIDSTAIAFEEVACQRLASYDINNTLLSGTMIYKDLCCYYNTKGKGYFVFPGFKIPMEKIDTYYKLYHVEKVTGSRIEKQ